MATVTRVLGCVFGAFFLLISLPMMLGGAVVLGLPAIMADEQGYMNAPTVHLQSDDSYAFVTESFVMNNQGTDGSDNDQSNFYVSDGFDNYGKIINFRVKASSYFIGLAPTSDVQQYLGNVRYEVVRDMNDHSISTYSMNVNKTGYLSSDPSNQSFWLASGTDVLYYTPSKDDFNKDLTFVVMKTDGSKGVNTDVTIGVDIPILKPIGIVLLVIGGIFFALTVTLFVIAYKSKDTPRNVKYITIPVHQQTTDQQLVPYSTTSKYCVNCGAQSDADANFCDSCGFAYKKQ